MKHMNQAMGTEIFGLAVWPAPKNAYTALLLGLWEGRVCEVCAHAMEF